MKFRDLRHLASTTAAQAGATLKEVMKMLGHSKPRGAMTYRHPAEDRVNVIAEGSKRSSRSTAAEPAA